MKNLALQKIEKREVISLKDSAQRFIQVRGQVRIPGEYIYKEGADLLYYLHKAGGATHSGALNNLMIFRREGGSKRALIYQIDELEALPRVKGGDVLVFHSVDDAERLFRLSCPRPILNERPVPCGNFDPVLHEYIESSGFKRVFNQILSAQLGSGMRTLAVLSQRPREGKTFIVANLALAFASFLNFRVLVVETTGAGESFFVSAPSQVSSDGAVEFRGEVEPVERAGRIDVLTMSALRNGLRDGAEFQIRGALAEFDAHYDVILLDTCALDAPDPQSLEPLVIAHQADAALLVSSPFSMDRPWNREQQLSLRSQTRLLGVVFNSGVQ